jgi:hypothetical protein
MAQDSVAVVTDTLTIVEAEVIPVAEEVAVVEE